MSADLLPDDELLGSWRAGERQAADRLIDRYGPRLYGFFAHKVSQGADELCERTFAECMDANQGDELASVRALFFAIARRVLLDRLGEDGRIVDPRKHSIASLQPGITEVVAALEPQRELQPALRRLSVDDQIVLELRHWEALGDDELAQVLEVEVRTIPIRVAHARAELEAQLAVVRQLVDQTVEVSQAEG